MHLPKENSRWVTGFLKARLNNQYEISDILKYVPSLTVKRLKKLEDGWAIPESHELIALSTLYDVDRDSLEKHFKLDMHY